jgi:hypothetical protein
MFHIGKAGIKASARVIMLVEQLAEFLKDTNEAR